MSHDRVNGDALLRLIDLLDDLPQHGGCEDLAIRVGTARELFESLNPESQRIVQALLDRPPYRPVRQFLSDNQLTLFPSLVGV